MQASREAHDNGAADYLVFHAIAVIDHFFAVTHADQLQLAGFHQRQQSLDPLTVAEHQACLLVPSWR